MGHKTRIGQVLYLACEGGKKSFAPRIEAISRAKSFLKEKRDSDNFLLLPLQVDLHGKQDAQAITAAIPEQKLSLIVVDTLAMSIGAGSENDSADMAQFIQNIGKLKAHYNCHVMIIHHTGKDKSRGARGHTSLRAAVDTEIEVKVDGSIRIAETKKQRDMENGKKVGFTLRVIELGLDDEHDQITSCVVEQSDADLSSVGRAKKVSPNERIAKQALDAAIAQFGRKMADKENYPANRNVVSIDNWRSVFLKMRIDSGAKEESVKKDFTRQSARLQESGIVHCYNAEVWIIYEEGRQDI
jgi:hypothetical protein